MTSKKPDQFATVTNESLLLAINAGMVKMRDAADIEEPHWYPCGFAWACIKIRKNHRLANVLKAHDWRWDDYHKHYKFSMPRKMIRFVSMSQSMDYSARCLNAFAAALRERGIPCHVQTHID